MNTPETINIEKYAHALNNLIGVDSAYMAGDKDVDAIVEVIVAAKKLENRVKELTEENEFHRKTISKNAQMALEVTVDEIEKTKSDTVRKMQEKLEKEIDRTIDMFDFKISECDAIRQVLRGVKNNIYQIAKELLEENI
jgi:hypothetical protein